MRGSAEEHVTVVPAKSKQCTCFILACGTLSGCASERGGPGISQNLFLLSFTYLAIGHNEEFIVLLLQGMCISVVITIDAAGFPIWNYLSYVDGTLMYTDVACSWSNTLRNVTGGKACV